MEFSKKILFLLVLALVVGASVGYSLGNKKPVTILEKNSEQITTGNEMTAEKKALIGQKLDLLKNYTNFVFLPPEATGDSLSYVEKMEKIVQSINDENITAKFYATGEAENKEQKIIDFLDFLNESIKADLQ
ncbi:hypothetical protein KJ761_03635 [Patescibacteria group bacterium]|nr:hypothetical protein [Patescibacteria group bacterium]